MLELICLALVATATTTSAFLLPFAASSSSTTAHNTRCCATAPTSSSSSSPLQQLDRLGALRFLAGAVALPVLVVLSPGSGVPSALAQDSSPAEEALARVIIVKDSTAQLVRTYLRVICRRRPLFASLPSFLPPRLPLAPLSEAPMLAKRVISISKPLNDARPKFGFQGSSMSLNYKAHSLFPSFSPSLLPPSLPPSLHLPPPPGRRAHER